MKARVSVRLKTNVRLLTALSDKDGQSRFVNAFKHLIVEMLIKSVDWALYFLMLSVSVSNGLIQELRENKRENITKGIRLTTRVE